MEYSKCPGGKLPIDLGILLQQLSRTAPNVANGSLGAMDTHQATPAASPLPSFNEDIIRRLLQERDEFWVLHSAMSHDRDHAYLDLNTMQDVLITSENRVNTLQTELNVSISRFEGRMPSG